MSPPEPDDLTVRQTLLNECDNYVFNELPSYLLDIRDIRNLTGTDRIRLSDIRLVSRSEISEEIRTQIEVDLRTAPKFNRANWCETHIHEHKSKYRYAILSHHLSGGEPEFQQMRRGEHTPEEQHLPAGIRKLLGFCRVAANEYDCPYAWSDTCCIDRQSSSELDEAIRSMYRWYEGSEICVVYLGASSLPENLQDDPWFKRGWTLQELLAPKNIKFYGKDWSPIRSSSEISRNDKKDEFMRKTIKTITGIPEDDIREFRPSHDRVSEKMRWMAPRQTRRTEDIAYSLIGIFDITMHIAYGEGTRAFYRFMGVLSGYCFDPSFLAWSGDPSPYSQALPISPSGYKLDGQRARLLELRGFDTSPANGGNPSYAVEKMGLKVTVLIIPIDESSNPSSLNTYILPAKRLGRTMMAIPVDNLDTELTPKRLRFAKRGRNEVLGVVNYHQVSPFRGKVSAKSSYFCLLLDRYKRKLVTKSVVLLKCGGTFEDKVESITLFHNTRISDSYLSF